MNGQVQFNNKNTTHHKEKSRFVSSGKKCLKNMYSGLSLLHNKCHEAMGCRDVSDFIKYLFTNKHGKTWINALCLAKCVKYQTLIKWYQNKIDEERMEAGSYVEKNEIESPGAMGVYNDLKMDAMIAKVAVSKVQQMASNFSRLAFFYLEKIFRPRPTTIYTFRIMSERDYAALQRKSCSEGYKSLLWGLFLIVTEHGFRWEKRESKTRHGNSKKKDYGDFILKTKSDLDKYPFLYEMSHMFCEAFTMTSPFAYKVTHDSIQPEGYIAYDETDGIWRPYLQQHAFRWLYPQFKHGNQYFKCLKHVKHNGLPMYIKTNPNDGLSASAKKSKKWSHSKFTKEIEEFEVEYGTPQGIQKEYLTLIQMHQCQEGNLRLTIKQTNQSRNM